MFRSSSNRKLNKSKENNTDVQGLKEDQKEFIKSNKLILKIQQRFRSEKHSVFSEEIIKINLSSNGDKRM